ncbi:MAG: MBL fold metallo-hydrolase [Candidatus Tectomicrobia bacterium]|nr:MBL fold metallo-hydrolase [Candidatus Tectomicrobia bacterium]
MSGKARVIVLGCGTSTGVPAIGCTDPVCLSDDPRNKRLRASILVQNERSSLLVDTGPDLREQALRHGIRRVDAVIYTHYHADHTHGIDDLRVLNFLMKRPIPCYAFPNTAQILRRNFSYIFGDGPDTPGFRPQLTLHEVDGGPFEAGGFRVQPVDLVHAGMRVMGLRIGDFAYATDCSAIPPHSMKTLVGVRVLILDALRHREHPAHLTVEQALAVVRELRPERTYFTHTHHDLEYHETNRKLPPGVEMAYDGLTFEIRCGEAGREGA